jgi:hypothetical protein
LIQDVLEGDKKRVAAFVEEQARDMFSEAEHFLKDIMNRAPLYRMARRLRKGRHPASLG